MPEIHYQTGNDLEIEEVIALYVASTLGERRPVEDRAIMTAMIRNADLIVTAWDERRLVGIARTLTDFDYVAYLADLAVHREYQRQGIGRVLVDRTKSLLGRKCMITLLAAPAAQEYYGKIGFTPNLRAWMWNPAG